MEQSRLSCIRRQVLLGAALVLASVPGLGCEPIAAQSVRLAASTPFSSYADPLAVDPGNGLIPAIFDALTIIERDGSIQPALAESWTATSDTTWQFRLRPGLIFHDGSPVNADVVSEYLAFLIEPESAAFFIATEVQSIVGVRKVDALTVDISTRQPDAILPRKLSRVPVLPLRIWREMGRLNFARAPVGTGPYKVAEWDNGGVSGATLTAVDTSWRPATQIRRVKYVVLPDPTTRLQSLLSGGVDIANSIDADAIPTVEAAGFRVSVQPGPINLAIAFHNCGAGDTPSKDLRVRQALAFSVDRQRIAEHLMSGITSVAAQGGTPGVFGYNADIEPYPFDPNAARTLLDSAGYDYDRKFVVAVFTGQFPSDALIFQQVAQDWTAIGVDVEFRRMAMPEYVRRLQAVEWDGIDAISAIWSHFQLGDISRALKQFSGAYHAPYFCSSELAAEVEATDAELDENTRKEKLQNLMARLHDLVPSLPLVQYVSVNALSPRVAEFKSRTGAILFEQMQIRDTP